MKSLVLKIYAFKFFSDFMLIYPLYAVMFADHGLSTGQIASILIVWSATVVVLEVPSGALADRYSRRMILGISQLIRAFGFASWLLFPTYWGFLLGFVLWGIRSALTSGTLEALVYDELKEAGAESYYGRIAGRGMAVSFVAIVLASLGAAGIAHLGYELLLLASIVAVIVSAIIPFTLPEVSRVEEEESDHPLKDYLATLRAGTRTVVRSPAILILVMFGAFSTGALGMLDEFWPLFANLVGASNSGVALMMASIGTIQGVTSFFAHRFEALPQKVFHLGVAISGLVLILAAAILEVWALVFIMAIAAFDPIVRIVYGAKLQHEIGSETRATVTSTMGFTTEIVAITASAFLGGVAEATSTQTSFMVTGGIVTVISLVFLFYGRQVRPEQGSRSDG